MISLCDPIEERAKLAGKKDYLLTLGITLPVPTMAANAEAAAKGPLLEQYAVAEVWDGNGISFPTADDAMNYGFFALGRTMGEIVDNQLFTYPLADNKYRNARITGFTIEPCIRSEDGRSVEEGLDGGTTINTQFKDEIRRALAFSEKPSPPVVRKDVGAHIKSAFADVPVGTFLTVAQIRTHSSAHWPDGGVGAGAISARLFPAVGPCTVEGIVGGRHPETGIKGAFKVSD